MGFLIRLCLLFVVVTSVECVDRQKLAIVPEPQKNFDVESYVGDWYFQYRLPPCSWKGSAQFSNFLSQYDLQPDRSIRLKSTYRSFACTSIGLVLRPEDKPGVYKMKDPIGDMISSTSVIVATDYKSFVIKWGCTKQALDGTCADPYVNVKTRHREIDSYTLKLIKSLLKKLWSLSLSEMVSYVQDDPCIVFEKKPHYKVHHLKKTY